MTDRSEIDPNGAAVATIGSGIATLASMNTHSPAAWIGLSPGAAGEVRASTGAGSSVVPDGISAGTSKTSVPAAFQIETRRVGLGASGVTAARASARCSSVGSRR